MYLQDRSSNSNYISEHFSQINDYEKRLNDSLVKLMSHTSNDYENTYINAQFKLISKSTIKRQIAQDHLNDAVENTHDIEESPISPLASFSYLILFITIAIALLYGVFWLVSTYEFAKFTVMIIVILVFLAIWSKK